MAAFEYVALSTDGQTHKGLTEADSERQARRQLRERNLVPVEVFRTEVSNSRVRGRRTRLPADVLALLTRLLARLLKSGMPLDDALLVLSRQSGGRHTTSLMMEARAGILEGHSLAKTMARFPRAFPDAYRATIGAGEQTRHLPLVLERLADHVEDATRARQTLAAAMIYPAVITITALLVVAGLLAFVIPEVTRVFDSAGRQLPAITQWLIAISDAVKAYGFYIATTVIGGAFMCRQLLRHAGFCAGFQRTCMRLPLIGTLIAERSAAQFARTLAVLLASGVNLVESLSIVAQTSTLIPFADAFSKCAGAVREGVSLSKALAGHEIIPPLLTYLVASGESSGDLPAMLDTAAGTFDHKTARMLSVITRLLEPALILVMGGIVLFIVLAILLPIFDMNQLV